jgi:LmbE family N-acetylglucosaminyl deacetylase
MLAVNFSRKDVSNLKILCLGAHSDDIEIGCGGTILHLLEKHKRAEVKWVVFGGIGVRTEEARKSANGFLKNAKTKDIIVKEFKDGFFPYHGAEIKKYFEQLKQEFSPDIVFTHYREDRHQDHRVISDLTWNSFRDHFILEYEIPKFDGDLGVPNLFVELEEKICRRKIQLIVSSFKTQSDKHWFSEQTFFSMLTLRGMESRSPTKFAEAFYCRKVVLA